MKDALPQGVYRYVVRSAARPQLYLALVSIALFGLSFVPLELQRRIVNSAIRDEVFDQLVTLCLAYLGIVLFQGGIKFLMNVMRGRISENAIRDIRLRVRLQIEDTKSNDEDSGKSVSLVAAEVEPLGGFIGESISSPLVQIGSLITILGYLTWVEPLMAAAAVLLFLPQFFFVPPMQAAINARSKARIEALRDVGDVIVDSADSGRREAREQGKEFAALIDRVFKQRISIFRIKFAMKFLINMLNHLGGIGVLFIGGWLVIEGRTEVGTIVAFLSGLQRIAEPGRMLVSFFRQLTEARVRYGLIREFFAERSSNRTDGAAS